MATIVRMYLFMGRDRTRGRWAWQIFLRRNYVHLSFTYDFGDKAEIYAGVNNVFDRDPPIVAAFGGYGNAFAAIYDYAGMTMFLGVTVNAFCFARTR